MTQSPADIVRRFWTEMASNDFTAAAQLLAEDFEAYWPQTDELIMGRAAFAALNNAYPAAGIWRFKMKSLVADAGTVVTDVDITDGVINDTAITFHTVKDGLIHRQVEYWPAPYDAPAWRAPYVTRKGPA